VTGLLLQVPRVLVRAARRWRPARRLVVATMVVGPVFALVAVALPSAPSALAAPTASPQTVPPPPSGWTTVFSDDFNGAAGSGVDSQWMYDTGPGSSFGMERQSNPFLAG